MENSGSTCPSPLIATVAEEASFNFNKADLKDMQNRTSLPLVVDWAIWNEKCEEARSNTSYACRAANSICYNSDDINASL
ncbi:hypothetical protein SAY87_006391 [Trapa incisa]|uniref:Uncharacterized protein n=1 Tax=Trapa incisa TaxID=236973 RepID=A0AAN7JZD6_9MYRT|nr:hypothetical protein SAY87_006391 [Trapa incisa]